MPKPLENKKEFTDFLDRYDKALLEKLSDMEQEDADRCAQCGGEDCICCEYYHDRKKWKSPEELFYNS